MDGWIGYLRNLGIILNFLELALVEMYEVFEQCVVAMHAVLSPSQIHSSLELLHIQQHVL